MDIHFNLESPHNQTVYLGNLFLASGARFSDLIYTLGEAGESAGYVESCSYCPIDGSSSYQIVGEGFSIKNRSVLLHWVEYMQFFDEPIKFGHGA
jgi:hypothetical protein